MGKFWSWLNFHVYNVLSCNEDGIKLFSPIDLGGL